MNKLKYILWIVGIVAWNFGFPAAKPVYDVLAALFLKHIFDLHKIFATPFTKYPSIIFSSDFFHNTLDIVFTFLGK